MKDIFTPNNKCLRCYHKIDAAMDPYGYNSPKDGDISICIKCGACQAFAKDMTLRPFTDAEIEKLWKMPELLNQLSKLTKIIYWVQESNNSWKLN